MSKFPRTPRHPSGDDDLWKVLGFLALWIVVIIVVLYLLAGVQS